MSWSPSDSTLQFRLWGGFGEALRRLGEAFGASEFIRLNYFTRMKSKGSEPKQLILGGFGEALGKLWGGFGWLWEAFGKLCEALGSFGRRWESLWEVFGRLWGSFGSLSEPFFSSRLLFLPYI